MTAGSIVREGFMDRLAQAGVAASFEKLTSQKLSIMKEAEQAGARVLCCWEEGQYEHRETSVRWQALTRGGLGVSSRQVYVLETAGVRHLYVQPFSGDARLPGTHHLWIHGALRSPILYDESKKTFFAGADHELARWLQGQPIAQVMRGIDWEWMITGRTRAVEPLVLQVRAGRGVGHVALRAFGSSGAMNSSGLGHHLVGFRLIPRIVQALLASVGAMGEEQPFFAEADGAETFGALLADAFPLPAQAAPIDLSLAINTSLTTTNLGTLTPAPLSPKKDAGARKELLPPWLAEEPILARQDKTVFGGGGRGVCFTPTHVAVCTDEGRAGISYADVSGAGAMVGTLVLRSRVHGDFSLSVSCPEAFAALLHAQLPVTVPPPP